MKIAQLIADQDGSLWYGLDVAGNVWALSSSCAPNGDPIIVATETRIVTPEELKAERAEKTP